MTGTAVVFQDGLGERRHTINSGSLLDLLVLRQELGGAPGFESSVRQRIDLLAPFQHPSIARVRGVGRVSNPQSRLVIAAEHTPGVRLSEVLTRAERQLIPLEFTAAIDVLRQVVRTVAALHEWAPHACHGALAPERLILTPEARVVVVEHMLAASLDQLPWPHERYWKELRIALPAASQPRLDRRADITQIGALAAALFLGRPLTENEYPSRMPEIVEGLSASAGTRLETLPAAVRSWLSRALQLDPRRSFVNAIEASVELDAAVALDERGSRDALVSFLARYTAAIESKEAPRAASIELARKPPAENVRETVSDVAPRGVEPLAPAATPVAAEATAADDLGQRSAEVEAAPPVIARGDDCRPEPEVPVPPASLEPGQALPAAMVEPARESAADPEPYAVETRPFVAQPEPVTTAAGFIARRSWRFVAAAAAVVVAIAAAGVASRSDARVRPTGTLVVQTNPPGVQAAVDGVQHGLTPLTLDLAPGNHVLELSADGNVRAIDVTITEGGQTMQVIEMPRIAPVLGRLHVRTEPAGAVVIVDGEVRGESPLVVEGLVPGVHRIGLRNSLGTVIEQVTIEPGATASLVIPLAAPPGAPVSGWISVAAPVEMQIFEEGRLLGSSGIDRIMMSAGNHQLEIRNAALGYQVTRTVQVSPGRVTPLRIDVPKGSLALNATPWAEVWVDGERVGETPIGNVQVPIGTRDVVFRHPQLGEQRHTVVVTLTGQARVSADFRKP